MIRIWLFICVPVGCCALSFCLAKNGWPARWIATISGSPVIHCQRDFKLGKRHLGEVTLTRFAIRNRGRRTRVINGVQSNCACSGLEREENGKIVGIDTLRIEPGKEVHVLMRLLVQGTPGQPSQNGVVLRTNDPKNRVVSIQASIDEVIAGFTAIPTSVAFGQVLIESPATRLVSVYDNAATPRSIDTVEVMNCPALRARVLPASPEIMTRREHDLGVLVGRVEIAADATSPASLNGYLKLVSSNRSHQPTVVSIDGRVVGHVDIAPSLVVLPRTSSAGAIYSSTCICRSTFGSSLEVRVIAASEGLTAEIEPASGSDSEKPMRISWDGIWRPGHKGNRMSVQAMATMGERKIAFEIPVLCLGKGRDHDD